MKAAPTLKNDKKGLRDRLDDIYKWSVKSGVATATPNSLKVQWDKVIEELNELLYHCNGNGDRSYLNVLWEEYVIDDIGDVLISFINLLNMNPKVKGGVFKQNAKRMDIVAEKILQAKGLSESAKKRVDTSELYIIDLIFGILHLAYQYKYKHPRESALFNFLEQFIYISRAINYKYHLKASLRNCIYNSYLEIKGRRYEIRVR